MKIVVRQRRRRLRAMSGQISPVRVIDAFVDGLDVRVWGLAARYPRRQGEGPVVGGRAFC
jgi:hypothetical protein